MKSIQFSQLSQVFFNLIDQSKHRHQFPVTFIYFFLGLCLNLALATQVSATTGITNHSALLAIIVLLMIIVALSIYLFVVIFWPERF